MERRNGRANRLLVIAASVGLLAIGGAVIAGAAVSRDDGHADAAPAPTEFTTPSTATMDHHPTTTTTATVATPTTIVTVGTLAPGSHPSHPVPVIVPGPTTSPPTDAAVPTTTPPTCIPRPSSYGAKDIGVTIHLDQTRVQRGTVIGATVTFSNPHDQSAHILMEAGWDYFTTVPGYSGPEWTSVPLTARPDIRHWATCESGWSYFMPPRSSVSATGTLDTTRFEPGNYPIETAISRGFPIEDFGGPRATFTVLPAPPTTTTPPTTG